MQGMRLSVKAWRGKAAVGLLALAILFRILIPAGWMPSTTSGYQITLCTGMGAVSAWIDKDGQLQKGKPAESKSDQSCLFAGAAAVLQLPSVDGLPIPPLAVTVALIAVRLATVDVGRGLAAPPPPPTGPPATL